jgi:hypothetical protein
MFNKIKILECPSRNVMCKCGSKHTNCSATAMMFITTDSHKITVAPSALPQKVENCIGGDRKVQFLKCSGKKTKTMYSVQNIYCYLI